LLNGKGKFPSEEKTETKIPIEKNIKETKSQKVISEIKHVENNTSNKKTIERIVIFYTDGSFKNFEDA
jgi:hypothetical protein